MSAGASEGPGLAAKGSKEPDLAGMPPLTQAESPAIVGRKVFWGMLSLLETPFRKPVAARAKALPIAWCHVCRGDQGSHTWTSGASS